MTEHLYQTDSYLKEFDAIVTAADGQAVVLDRTAFYPGGGGQPPDWGSLTWDGGSASVVKVKRRGADVVHTLDGDPPPVGAADALAVTVRGTLDWERRYRLMRTHTALHVLCGVVWRDYGASVTGGNMEPLKGRMDFEFETMHKELVAEIEARVNAEIEKSRPVRIAILPREEAFQIPNLIRTKINLLPPQIQEVRTVEIVGLDLQADGGSHVANTSEVGPVRVVDYKSKGAINKRIYIELDR
jgi:misacylated tRNA(Ala) deacylase